MGRKKQQAPAGSVRNRNTQNLAVSASAKSAPKIYRDASIGKALQTVTGKLNAEGKIKATLQSHIMNTFDEKISEGLRKVMEGSGAPIMLPPMIFIAENYTQYNVIDGIFNVTLKNATLDAYKNPTKVKKLNIKAFNYADNSLDQMVKDKALSSASTSKALVLRGNK